MLKVRVLLCAIKHRHHERRLSFIAANTECKVSMMNNVTINNVISCLEYCEITIFATNPGNGI